MFAHLATRYAGIGGIPAAGRRTPLAPGALWRSGARECRTFGCAPAGLPASHWCRDDTSPTVGGLDKPGLVLKTALQRQGPAFGRDHAAATQALHPMNMFASWLTKGHHAQVLGGRRSAIAEPTGRLTPAWRIGPPPKWGWSETDDQTPGFDPPSDAGSHSGHRFIYQEDGMTSHDVVEMLRQLLWAGFAVGIACCSIDPAVAQDATAGAAVFKSQCGSTPGAGGSTVGPSLFGIVGSAAAAEGSGIPTIPLRHESIVG